MAKITQGMSDAQIRKVLRMEKKRRMRIRVAKRLGILIVVFLLAVYLLVTGIQKLIVKVTYAASSDSAARQEEMAEEEPAEETPTQRELAMERLAQEEERSQEYAGESRGTIFVDAGHGGNDPGAEDLGRKEADDNLLMARSIAVALRKEGYEVILSRTEDESVEREARGEMANQAGAELMISCHRNQAESDGRGVEMYVPSAGEDLDLLLAENIMEEMEAVGISENRGIHCGTLNDPADDYAENRTSDMPSVLVEFGFISSEEDNLLFDKHLLDYGEAAAKGIIRTYQAIYEE